MFDVHRKNKKQKENISVTTSKQEQSFMGLQNPNQNKPEIQNAITVCPQKLNQRMDELVPPLKHPPKNIMALMEQIQRGRTGRLYEGMYNLHLNRHPCNSDMMGHMNHWPIDASHRRTAQAHFNVNMTGAGYVRVCPKFGTMRGSENMGLNCERKYFGNGYQGGREEEIQANVRELINRRNNYKDDDECHWDFLKDETGRGENYIQGKRFMRGREKEQANRRRVLVDMNMDDRGSLGMNCKFGEEYCMDHVEDRNGRRNYNNVEESMCPPRKPLGWEHAPRNYEAERSSFGGTMKDRFFRSVSKMTEHVGRDDMGELVGHSRSVIEEGTRAKKGHCRSNKKGAGSGDVNSKRRGLLLAPPKSGSRHRRRQKQARK